MAHVVEADSDCAVFIDWKHSSIVLVWCALSIDMIWYDLIRVRFDMNIIWYDTETVCLSYAASCNHCYTVYSIQLYIVSYVMIWIYLECPHDMNQPSCTLRMVICLWLLHYLFCLRLCACKHEDHQMVERPFGRQYAFASPPMWNVSWFLLKVVSAFRVCIHDSWHWLWPNQWYDTQCTMQTWGWCRMRKKTCTPEFWTLSLGMSPITQLKVFGEVLGWTKCDLAMMRWG